MEMPFHDLNSQRLVPPQVQVAIQLNQVNEYLEILVDLLLKQFPNLASEDLSRQVEEAREWRGKIGFHP
ncbi:MAG: hypothetical protein ACYDDI_04990 [Candidatus Acidiferrales bacterium]